MAWDGSGNFSRTNGTQTGASTWANARDAGNNITASQHDTHDQDLATGIAATLTKNGESKPTADFKPNADNLYSLGSTALRWVNGFFAGYLRGVTQFLDANGNELLKLGTTSSAVNEVTVTNAATGTPPRIHATGETDVGLQLEPKGTGRVTFTDGTDTAKKVSLVLSGITTANDRQITPPDENFTMVGVATAQTLTNKTLTAPVLNGALTGDAIAAQAEMETGTATDSIVSPGNQHFHASAAKFWVDFSPVGGTGAATVNASYNVTGVNDDGTGLWTTTIATDFSSANWAAFVSQFTGTQDYITAINAKTAGTLQLSVFDLAGTAVDITDGHMCGFGDL